MEYIAFLLGGITFLLFWIAWNISDIRGRLRERFPTKKEEDYRWSQEDPMGHWEAHRAEEESRKK
jgi:hypothetical protein